MENCVFCNIVKKQVSAKVEYENESFIVFHDIHPDAPLHLLIVPKKHIQSIDHVAIEDKELMGELVLVAQRVAKQKNLNGYRLEINVGRKGGQIVNHLHVHLLAQQP